MTLALLLSFPLDACPELGWLDPEVLALFVRPLSMVLGLVHIVATHAYISFSLHPHHRFFFFLVFFHNLLLMDEFVNCFE